MNVELFWQTRDIHVALMDLDIPEVDEESLPLSLTTEEFSLLALRGRNTGYPGLERVHMYLTGPYCEDAIDELNVAITKRGFKWPDAHRCEDCDNFFDTSNGGVSDADDSKNVCQSCIDYNYVYSSPMGHYINSEDAVHSEDGDNYAPSRYAIRNWYESDDGEWYENEQGSDDDEESGDVDDAGRLPSDANPVDLLGWPSENKHTDLVFGVELEMEALSYTSRVVNALDTDNGIDTKRRFIIKYDGSLDSTGVELCTLPYTLDQHRAKDSWINEILTPYLAKYAKSGRNTTACGMHIHINRAALTPFQIGKMLVLLNSPVLSRFITIVAQRESGGYCARSAKKLIDGKVTNSNKYDVLHLTRNTVELRMFRGNLRPDRVLKNIEFAHALVCYTRTASATALESIDTLATWLIERRGQYPELCRFLCEQEVGRFKDLKFQPRKKAA